MKQITAGILLLLSSATASAAISCQDAPGREQGGHWSWREIDGRRCWFKSAGARPRKSELTWKKGENARDVVKETAALPAMEKPGPTIQMLKTASVPEGMSEVAANWLDDAPINLTTGEDLHGPAGIGGNWVIPAYAANADETPSFAMRFAPVIEFRQAGTNQD
jgi:hypothetical protein